MKWPAVELILGGWRRGLPLSMVLASILLCHRSLASSWSYLDRYPTSGRLNAASGLVAVGDRGCILLASPHFTPVDSGVSENLLSVVFAENSYLVGGDGGVILTSADGINWVSQRPFGSRRWISVQYKSGKWYVCAEDGTLLSSSSPSSRAWVPSGIPLSLINESSITVFDCSGPEFAVGGVGGAILFSSDLRTWRLSRVPSGGLVRDLEFGGYYTGVRGGPGYWLAAVADQVWKSEDAQTWNVLELPVREVIHGMKSLGDGPKSVNQVWMLVGNNGFALSSRTNGPWRVQFPQKSNRAQHMDFYGTAFLNGNWYLVGDEGTTFSQGLVEPVAGRWNFHPQSRATRLEQPDYTCVLGAGDDVVIAGYGMEEGGANGGWWLTNSTWVGITFGARQGYNVTTPTNDGSVTTFLAGDRWLRIQGLATDGRQWIACGADGKVFFADRSSNNKLTNWATLGAVSHGSVEGGLSGISEVGTSRTLHAAGYGGGTWVMVGEEGTIRSTSTPRPIVWSGNESPTRNSLFAVKYAAGTWIAVGDQETILRSSDGKVWKKVHGVEGKEAVEGCGALLRNCLWSVEYGAGQWLAVGDEGLLLLSRDGVAWSRIDSRIQLSLRAVQFAAGTWMVVGDNGFLASSSHGVDWVVQPAVTDRMLRGLTVRGSGDKAMWIVVGSGSVVLTMPVTVNPAGLLPVGGLEWGNEEEGTFLRWNPGNGQWLLTESERLEGPYGASLLETRVSDGLVRTSVIRPSGSARFYQLRSSSP